MKQVAATFAFYFSLAIAWLLLRGRLTSFPALVDMLLSFAVSAGGLVLWAMAWRSAHPAARPLAGRALFNWRQLSLWIALGGFLLASFIGPLPWAAEKIASVRGEPQTSPGDAESPTASVSRPAPPAEEGAIQPAAASGSEESAPAAAAVRAESTVVRAMNSVRELPRRWRLSVVAALIAALACVVWLWIRALAATSVGSHERDARSSTQTPVPPYLREFVRLCRYHGCSPEPGHTVRELMGQLGSSGFPIQILEPLAVYHYGVCYENVAVQPASERWLRRILRDARRRKRPGLQNHPLV